MDEKRRERLWREVVERIEAPDRQGWARAVCRTCVAVLAGADAAVLTLRADGRAQEMLGASDEWAANRGEMQYTLGEGPGVEAFTTGGPVLVADLTVEHARWPGFADAALSTGTTAMFAFPLQVGAIRLGMLELYRGRPGGLSGSQRTDAAVLADLATSALLEDTEQAERTGADRVRAASSSEDVNVATGMLAARLRISVEDAFARLRGHAYTENRSVFDVARDILTERVRTDELAD